jgi:hypothetical protein
LINGGIILNWIATLGLIDGLGQKNMEMGINFHIEYATLYSY